MKYKDRKLRHEFKYIINKHFYEILRMRFMQALTPDTNSIGNQYRVTSVYFDDLYRSSYYDKLMGCQTRRKFRMRAYNLSPKKITLEAKHKNNEYISKVNTSLTYEQYLALLNGDLNFYHDNKDFYINSSLEDFAVSNFLVRPRPMVVVDYFREAYVNKAGNVRITFDKSLSTCYETMDMFDQNAIFCPVLGNDIIMEIKYDNFMPMFVEQLLSGVPMIKESVSKFVICTDKLLEVKKQCVY